MTIFVTGGAGYIGSHTCVELLMSGFDIVVADNFANSSYEAIDRARRITGKDIPFYEEDVRDVRAMNAIFDRHAIDCVIHFAGLKAVGESVSKPVEYYDNNLVSTLSLAKAMAHAGVKRLVFSSSATVYRGDNPMPLTEDASTGCTNPYGWTKYMCEQILRDAAQAQGDWSVALLRYFNPVGAHPSGMIGEDPADIPNNLMPYIAQTAIGRLPILSVYGGDYDTPDGTGVRDYIHVVDLARGHVSAIRYLMANAGVSVFNLGTGRGTSVLEIVKTFEQVTGAKVPYQIVDRRPGDLATCYADPSRAEAQLHWRTEKTLAQMCEDAWRWQTQNPMGYRKR